MESKDLYLRIVGLLENVKSYSNNELKKLPESSTLRYHHEIRLLKAINCIKDLELVHGFSDQYMSHVLTTIGLLLDETKHDVKHNTSIEIKPRPDYV